jgi:hypothetical protein
MLGHMKLVLSCSSIPEHRPPTLIWGLQLVSEDLWLQPTNTKVGPDGVESWGDRMSGGARMCYTLSCLSGKLQG